MTDPIAPVAFGAEPATRRLRSNAGLTLLEVLLALAILGTIFALLAVAFAGTVRLLEAGEGRNPTPHVARAALSLLAQELSAGRNSMVFPWMGRDRLEDGWPADRLAFVSAAHTPAHAPVPAGDITRLLYVREGSRLVRYAMSNLQSVAPESIEPAELATGVVGFNLRYYDGRRKQWVDEWNGRERTSTPTAILIELTLQAGGREPATYAEWVAIVPQASS
jgi:general secretion pathway protein J